MNKRILAIINKIKELLKPSRNTKAVTLKTSRFKYGKEKETPWNDKFCLDIKENVITLLDSSNILLREQRYKDQRYTENKDLK